MNPPKHQEIHFESDIVAHLTRHGWLEGDPAKYDRELALYPEDVFTWFQETQPKTCEKLKAAKNTGAEAALLARLAQVLDTDGCLSVLRHGFKDVSTKLDMCQFRPAQTINAETLERYSKVRCRVIRQVRYGLSNENAIDLVFFINGIPVATAELKTDFTQSVDDAKKQYRYDRIPREPGTKREEPLLAFKRRALVHFAVSTDEVWMTTELKGKNTYFLPFNLGNHGGAGNPPNPTGYRTSYWWERILQRDAWLNIIGRFVHLAKEEKRTLEGKKQVRETLIFPRFHQWEAVTKLLATAKVEKAGHKYLIQHSAGSGKSNSIAWLAHQLSNLHDDADGKVFSSVIVITDRTVLDQQLQDTIYQFEHKAGVVCKVTNEGVKSAQLAEALKDSVPIIIVTIQTFPFVMEAIQKETSLKNRTFAVIADEAHSSQTGAAAKELKRVLTAEQITEGEEIGDDEVLAAEIAARPQQKSLSYFAFTATPKAKTLEMFGRRQYPDQPASKTNKPEAFHVYSMRQAIEEDFILDVLKNYTPYKLAFKLAHNGKDYDDETVDQSEAMKSLMRWVRLHPHNISQKAQIIVEHFRSNVAWRLDGHAKAMVVTASRKEAVRYKLAVDKYINQQGYKDLATLVAFSGDVDDPESGPQPFSENNMNPGLKGRDLREAFDTEEFQVLLVANKYQTGFDQPKLVSMYVDKKLANVAAVQTLSRLNRTYPGKDQTFVLDFVNEPQDIVAAFQPYYETAELEDVSDPNLIHALQSKLDAELIYTPEEVDAFITVYFKGQQKDMQAKIAPAVERFRVRWNDAEAENDKEAKDGLIVFRRDVGAFVRAYDFLSQIVDFGDTDLEKRSIFLKHLLPLLREVRTDVGIDLSEVKLTHYKLSNKGKLDIKLAAGAEDAKLKPITELGSGKPHDPEMVQLALVVDKMNDLFEGVSETDVLPFALHITGTMMESETLEQQAGANSKEQFEASPDFKNIMIESVADGLDKYSGMAKQVLNNPKLQDEFAALISGLLYERFAKRRGDTGGSRAV
ncbi:type I restriction endonuclease subunit R [Paraburkholderia sp. MM6662-R1]|uniref:type I restriction endonuclease subunit R n=1 Tax=Paraburkholderia sp. MM6662-R1 TaxID=2991066 RepID=UPI003D1CDF51